ncbi:unnamed protein product [Parajaminaea phylloscopi]
MDNLAWAAPFDEAGSTHSHATTDSEFAPPSASPRKRSFTFGSARGEVRKSVRAVAPANNDRSLVEGVFVVSKKGPSWLSERQFNMLGTDRPGSQASLRHRPPPVAASAAVASAVAAAGRDLRTNDHEVTEDEGRSRMSESSDAHSVSSARSWPVLPDESRRRELRNSRMIMMDHASQLFSDSFGPASASPSNSSFAALPASMVAEQDESPQRLSATSNRLHRKEPSLDRCFDGVPHGLAMRDGGAHDTPKEELSQEKIFGRRLSRPHSFIQAFKEGNNWISFEDNESCAGGLPSDKQQNEPLPTFDPSSVGEEECTEIDEREYWSDSRSSNRSTSSLRRSGVLRSHDTSADGVSFFDPSQERQPHSVDLGTDGAPLWPDNRRTLMPRTRPLVLPQMATVAATTRQRRLSGQLTGQLTASSRRSSFRLEPAANASSLSINIRSSAVIPVVPPAQTLTRVRSQQAKHDRWSKSSGSDDFSSDGGSFDDDDEEEEEENANLPAATARVVEVKVAKKAITRADALLLLNTRPLLGNGSIPPTPSRQFKDAGVQTTTEESVLENGLATLGSRRARPQLSIITGRAQQENVTESLNPSPKERSLASEKASLAPPLPSSAVSCPECGDTFDQAHTPNPRVPRRHFGGNLATPPAPHSARALAQARIQARATQRQDPTISPLLHRERHKPDIVSASSTHCPPELFGDTVSSSVDSLLLKWPADGGDPESAIEEVSVLDGEQSNDRHRLPFDHSEAKRHSKDSLTSLDYHGGKRGSGGTNLVGALKSKLSEVNLSAALRSGRSSRPSTADMSFGSGQNDRPPSQLSFNSAFARLTQDSGLCVSAKAFDDEPVGRRPYELLPPTNIGARLLQRPNSSGDGARTARGWSSSSRSGSISTIGSSLAPSVRPWLPGAAKSDTEAAASTPRERIIDPEVCPWDADIAPPPVSKTSKRLSDSELDTDNESDDDLLPRSAPNMSAKALKLLGLPAGGGGDPEPSPMAHTPTIAAGEKPTGEKGKTLSFRGVKPLQRRLSSSNISGPFDVMHVGGSSKQGDDTPTPLANLKAHQSSTDLSALTRDRGVVATGPATSIVTSMTSRWLGQSDQSASPSALPSPSTSSSPQALRKMRSAWRKNRNVVQGGSDGELTIRHIPAVPPLPSTLANAVSVEPSEPPPSYRLPSLELSSARDSGQTARQGEPYSLNLFGEGPLLEALESTAAAALALSQIEEAEGSQGVTVVLPSNLAPGGIAAMEVTVSEKELQLAQKRKRAEEAYKRSSSAWNPRADYL